MQRRKKGKRLYLKASVHKWDTNEHLEGINTRKKINPSFSSSAKKSHLIRKYGTENREWEGAMQSLWLPVVH